MEAKNKKRTKGASEGPVSRRRVANSQKEHVEVPSREEQENRISPGRRQNSQDIASNLKRQTKKTPKTSEKQEPPTTRRNTRSNRTSETMEKESRPQEPAERPDSDFPLDIPDFRSFLSRGMDSFEEALFMPSSIFQEIAEQLESGSDEFKTLDALSQLKSALMYANEDRVRPLPTSIVKALVRILGQRHSANLMVTAAETLNQLCESLPSTLDSLIRHGALPVICECLLSIEVIDAAEYVSLALFPPFAAAFCRCSLSYSNCFSPDFGLL